MSYPAQAEGLGKYDKANHILSTQAKEFTAATSVMQNSSNELSPLVSGKAKYKQTKANT